MAPPPPPLNTKPPTAIESAQAWIAVRDSDDTAALEAFLARHGDSIYADMARAKIGGLGDGTTRANVAMVVSPRPAPADTLKPKDTVRDCPNCPEMVVIPAGTFMMGSPDSEVGRAANENPQHNVTIAKAFAVGKFAVTFDEWDACVAAGGCNGYKPADEAGRRGRHPVVNVSWDDAKSYVAWLSRTTGKTYRLLSEAEREYVARAGSTSPFWFGTTISAKQANYNGQIVYASGEKSEFRKRALPVDFFAANPFGLYQVHGNVYEWTEDCWRASYAGAPIDGSARTRVDCDARTLRGGSLTDAPDVLRSAARSGFASSERSSRIGFRVARLL